MDSSALTAARAHSIASEHPVTFGFGEVQAQIKNNERPMPQRSPSYAPRIDGDRISSASMPDATGLWSAIISPAPFNAASDATKFDEETQFLSRRHAARKATFFEDEKQRLEPHPGNESAGRVRSIKLRTEMKMHGEHSKERSLTAYASEERSSSPEPRAVAFPGARSPQVKIPARSAPLPAEIVGSSDSVPLSAGGLYQMYEGITRIQMRQKNLS